MLTGGAIVTRAAVILTMSVTVSGTETLGGMATGRSTAGVGMTAGTLDPSAASV